MFPFFIRLLINAAALFFIAGMSGGAIQLKNPLDAMLAALILGLANAVVKPVLQLVAGALTLPLSCLTLGLWNLVLSLLINGLLFWGVGRLVEGFEVSGFWPAVLGALAMSVISSLGSALFSKEKQTRE